MKQGLLRVGLVVFWLSACGGRSEDGHSDRDGADDGTRAQPDRDDQSTEAETDPELSPTDSSSDDDAAPQEDPAQTAPGNDGQQPVDVPGLTPPVCAEHALDESQERDEPEGELSCDSAFVPCGGDVVGTWRVRDCPLELTGQMDIKGFGLGCSTAEVLSGTLEVSGIWTADETGNIVDCTVTRGVQQFELASECFDVLAADCSSVSVPFERALGYASVECVEDLQTGDCVCDATIDQRGGLAMLSPEPLEEGRYSVAGTSLSTKGLGYEATYEHCVMDDTLTLTAAGASLTGLVEGSIVLERE